MAAEIQAELLASSFGSCWELYVAGCRAMGIQVPADPGAMVDRERWQMIDGVVQLGDLVVLSGREARGVRREGGTKTWTMPGAGEKPGEHVGFALDAFRFVHLVSGHGPVVCELRHYRRNDPAMRVARLKAGGSGAGSSLPLAPSLGEGKQNGSPITVRVVMLSDLLAHHVVRENSPRSLDRAMTLGEAFAELTGVPWDTAAWIVIRNGQILGGDSGADPAGEMLADGDELKIAPRPREITTTSLILLTIGLLASTLSTFLLPHLLNKPRTSADAPGRQFGFDRYSRPAIAGEPMPTQLGPKNRYGGKVVNSLPGEGSDGNTRLRLLIDLEAGPMNKIGSFSADADGVDVGDPRCIGIFGNETPIAQFPGGRVSVRMGAPSQAPIPGFDDVERLREVGVGGSPLANTSGSDRTSGSPSGEVASFSTDDVVESFVVRVRFADGLFTAGGSGQIMARRVQYRVRQRTSDVGAGAGAWSAWTVVSVERADQSAFVSAFRANGLGLLKYDIQVERVTAEISGTAAALTHDAMKWDSLIQIRLGDNNYEGRAVLAIELVAGESLTSEPKISVDVEGYKGLRIWDGISSPSAPVFVTGYSDNPAWMALELITNKTWGMGAQYSDDNINFPRLIEWAQRCDEVVPTSTGGTRKRYRCGLVISEARPGEEWLRTICEAGRAVAASAGDVWTFLEYKAAEAIERFTEGSIAVDESTGRTSAVYRREFTTEGLTRPNQMVAQFEDAALDGRVNSIVWPRYGTLWLATEPLRQEPVRLDGIFDAEQALWEIRFRLKRLRFLSRSLTFVTTREVVTCQPGDRIDVALSLAGWGAGSGLVAAGCTTTSVVLDRDVTLGAGTNVIKVEHADGGLEMVGVVSPAGFYARGSRIDTEAFADAPAEFDEYAIGGPQTVMKPFTCTRVALEDPEKLTWKIEGIEYDAATYDETAEAPTSITYSTLPDPRVPPGPVTNLSVSDRLVTEGESTRLSVSLAWAQGPADAAKTAGFYVYYRLVGGETWIRSSVASVSRSAAVVELTELDFAYQFKVCAFSHAGASLSPYDPSVPAIELSHGLGVEPPAPPTGLTLAAVSGVYTLSWDQAENASDYQVLYGGVTGATPNDGAEDCLVFARVAGGHVFGGRPSVSLLNLPAGQAVRYYVRSVSASSRLSWTATAIDLGSAATPPGKAIKTTTSFTLASDGTRTNLTWDGGQSRLELTSPASDGIYTTQEVDTGSLTVGTLALKMLTKNDAADPAIVDCPWAMPSIEADQWGVVSGSGATAVLGMLMPPYPDDRQEYEIDVRTWDGVIWSSWERWAHPHQGVTRLFQKYQVRVTMRRSVAPYRPALSALTGVVVH